MHPIDTLGRPAAAVLLAGWAAWHAVGFWRWDRARRAAQAHQAAMRALARRHRAMRRG